MTLRFLKGNRGCLLETFNTCFLGWVRFPFLSFFIEVLAYLKNSGKQTSMWRVYWIDLDWNHQDSNKSRTKIDNDQPKSGCLSSNGPRIIIGPESFLFELIYHFHPSSADIKKLLRKDVSRPFVSWRALSCGNRGTCSEQRVGGETLSFAK